MEKQSDKETEFERMLTCHETAIIKLCFFYAETPDEVSDMRQEVLLNLWRGWDSFRGDSTLSTWVHRVTLNTCVSYNRRERRHRSGGYGIADVSALADDGEDRTALWREMHARISQLNTRDRAIILLWLEDFSYDEIASVTGLNRNTVATQLHRIKQKLSQQ